ncbi:MAG: 16S rRNA (adenine(1518)-N(6)/adenine(1519)-N(6))-dimethyltransferase RsmA [Spirochaetaceae bacterium]|nr:16S rRNA (adenine(1518)-N(6)/adenine(1519)-N(6))-dimethyltransferase RsmA [Spirochaetaceae bacterium]
MKIRTFLAARGMSAHRRFGQNFLVNGTVRERILDHLDILPGQTLWEVGPGLGAMTSGLLARGAVVTAFEIDRGFIALLPALFPEAHTASRLIIIPGDVLKTWKPALAAQQAPPSRLFGNLPYNIAATLIANTITAGVRFDRCVFTVQKEVAQRMAAGPGTFASAFSVLCAWAYRVDPLFDLAPGNFWPRPKVSSTVVRLTPRSGFPGGTDPAHFARLVHGAFASRRKTIRNNLTILLGSPAAQAALAAAGIDGASRPEQISVEGYTALAQCVRL